MALTTNDPQRLRTGAYFFFACLPVMLWGAAQVRDSAPRLLAVLALTAFVGGAGALVWRKAARLTPQSSRSRV